MKHLFATILLLPACLPPPLRGPWRAAQECECRPLRHVGCCEQRARVLQRALAAVGVEGRLEIWCTQGRLHMILRVGELVLDPTTGDVLSYTEGLLVWREG